MRKCSRMIDKPLLILGLEPEDVAVLLFFIGGSSILFSPTIPIICLLFLWPMLVVFKRGRPSGYVLHFLYKLGMPMKGLIPPGEGYFLSPFGKKILYDA